MCILLKLKVGYTILNIFGMFWLNTISVKIILVKKRVYCVYKRSGSIYSSNAIQEFLISKLIKKEYREAKIINNKLLFFLHSKTIP